MPKHKNNYSVIVFFKDKSRAKKWQYAHKLNGFAMFLDKSHSNWDYMNVYDRRTGNYLRRFYKGAFIPPFID